MVRCPWLPLMSAMLQKLLIHWVGGASVAVPFVGFPPKFTVPYNSYLSCCGGREYKRQGGGCLGCSGPLANQKRVLD